MVFLAVEAVLVAQLLTAGSISKGMVEMAGMIETSRRISQGAIGISDRNDDRRLRPFDPELPWPGLVRLHTEILEILGIDRESTMTPGIDVAILDHRCPPSQCAQPSIGVTSGERPMIESDAIEV